VIGWGQFVRIADRVGQGDLNIEDPLGRLVSDLEVDRLV
jgi:hypothetical protein